MGRLNALRLIVGLVVSTKIIKIITGITTVLIRSGTSHQSIIHLRWKLLSLLVNDVVR